MQDINIQDIAKMAKVSVSTVSRVINNHPDVSKQTKKNVKAIIDKYSYVPNNSARSLRRDFFNSVGVLIKGITNPFFSRMIGIIEQEITKNSYSMILHQVEIEESEVDAAIRLTKEKKPKGLIFLGGNFEQSQEKLNSIDIPFVLTTITTIDGVDRTKFSSVTINDFQEAYKVVDFICKSGHRRIGIVGAAKGDKSIGRLRLDGYLAALKDNRIPYDFSLIAQAKDYSMRAGYESTIQLLKRSDFTCLFCISDTLAFGACKAIDDSGLKIPENISIVGFDGIDMAKYFIPTLTTVRQPDEEMAHASVRIIMNCMKNGSAPQHIKFETKMIQGESFRALL